MDRKKLFIVVPGVLIQAAIAYFAIVYLLLPGIATKATDPTEATEPEPLPSAGIVYTVSDIIVNPAETLGTRYLNVTVGLEVADAKAVEQLKKREIELRDLLIDTFSSRRLDQLDGIDDRESLREEIMEKVNQLTAHQLIRVFFSNFVLQ